jgi:hypothetical protein
MTKSMHSAYDEKEGTRMTTKPVFVVVCSTIPQGSNRTYQKPVRAFLDKEKAHEFARQAQDAVPALAYHIQATELEE